MTIKKSFWTTDHYKVYQDGTMYKPQLVTTIIDGHAIWELENGLHITHKDLMFHLVNEYKETYFIQCTGKTDKNNHPIFKYDYVKTETGEVILVEFVNEKWTIDDIDWSKCEIVGNSFETPDAFYEYHCSRCHTGFADDEELRDIGDYKLCTGCREEFEDWVKP